MPVTGQDMTDERRKSVAASYLIAPDSGEVSSGDESIAVLMADDGQLYSPSCGTSEGNDEIPTVLGDIRATLKSIVQHHADSNWVFSGSALCEGTSHREHRDGPCHLGEPERGAGWWSDSFETRSWRIQRSLVYLDPDYAAENTQPYPWPSQEGEEL